jgi:branched-chain amino acid transport system ATP-binding protein
MLAIARPLLLNARLMLLDEPSQGLAPLIVQEVMGVVRAMRAEGLSVLLVEQNVPLSLEVADRAYILDDGKVVFRRPGGDARRRPRTGAKAGRRDRAALTSRPPELRR